MQLLKGGAIVRNWCASPCGECVHLCVSRLAYLAAKQERKKCKGVSIHVLRPWELAEMKNPKTEVSANGERQKPEEGFLTEFPRVWELLSDPVYDDGTERKLATLMVFCDGANVKICVSDKDTDRIVFSTGPSLRLALASLDDSLANGVADWRKQAGGKAKGR